MSSNTFMGALVEHAEKHDLSEKALFNSYGLKWGAAILRARETGEVGQPSNPPIVWEVKSKPTGSTMTTPMTSAPCTAMKKKEGRSDEH